MNNYIEFVLVGEETEAPNILEKITEKWKVEPTIFTALEKEEEYNVVRIEKSKNILKVLIYSQEVVYNLEIKEKTYSNYKKIVIVIKSKKNKGEYDKFLEKLKVDTMNLIMSEWKNSRCYWLVDNQSEELSQNIYIEINKLENRLRSFINIAMIDMLGVEWWETVSVAKFGKKYYSEKVHERKSREYKDKFSRFKNIQDELLTLNSDDLSELMAIKISEWDYSEENWKKLEEKIKSKEIGEIISIYESQKKVKKVLWDDLFSKYFDRIFLNQWGEFCKMRNHIAHNKLVDYSGVEDLKNLINRIDEKITEAERRFEETTISQEEREIIAESYEEELDQKFLAGIKLGVMERNSNQIKLDFKYVIENFFEDILHSYKYKDGLEIEVSTDIYSESIKIPKKIIFKETYGERKMSLIIERDEINELPGSISFLEISLKKSDLSEIKEKYIYENGELKLNDAGEYVISKEDKEDFEGLEKIFNYIEEEITEKFLSLDDKVAELYENSKIYKELKCSSCGEEAILNEDYMELQKNQCFFCKSLNNIYRCETCGTLCNEDLEEGERKLCFDCIEED